jgi:hypothetical protein
MPFQALINPVSLGLTMATQHDQPKLNHLFVAVITTAGVFPSQGFDEVPQHQPVKVELAHAAGELKITNTDGWVATVAGKTLNVEQNYIENHLTGTVEIHWGPPEGGGGGLP